MPKVNVYDMKGNVVEEIELDSNIFGVEVNTHCMHMAVVNNLANKRQGTHSTLVKSEVSGGGKKPYRQKGTGRARQGSTRSAQWIHGGIVFGPKPRDYSYTIPKKVKRLALKSSLTSKAIDGDIIVLDNLSFNEIKTKNSRPPDIERKRIRRSNEERSGICSPITPIIDLRHQAKPSGNRLRIHPDRRQSGRRFLPGQSFHRKASNGICTGIRRK